uniref:Alanine--glyoxylate and serine--pyruvate aminotransferase a n=1 Tax=Scleropages formosus TaxID=113540 RepID=A0A8C9STD3_SCLFO
MLTALSHRGVILARGVNAHSCLSRVLHPPSACRSRRAMGSVSIPPPASLLRPLETPQRLLSGPGPSNVPPRVLAAAARQIIGHMHGEMLEIMDDIKKGIQYAFQTQNNMTLAMSGPGHVAMECAIFNTVESGESVLVAVNGIWGERAAEIAERIGARVNTIVKPPGGYFTKEEIEQVDLQLVFFFSHSHNCLFLLDAVASLGGSPILMDKQGIDILYTGSQKVLNSPPGTAPISFSERACKKMFHRKTKPLSYFLDMGWLANYWGCDGKPTRTYHHTGPISGFFTLRESLAILAEMGLENSWNRHKEVAEHLHKGLESMGFKLFVQEKHVRLPTVTTITVPPGYDWREITVYAMKHHNVEISGGLGPSSGMVGLPLSFHMTCLASSLIKISRKKDVQKTCHKRESESGPKKKKKVCVMCFRCCA